MSDVKKLIIECESSIKWLEGAWVRDYPKARGNDDGLWEAMRETASHFDDLLAWFRDDHPADDSDLITADWLHTTSMEYCDIERKFIALDGDGHSLAYEAHGVMGWCFNGCSLHKQPRTRWELRRLADALGFDLKEGKA